MTLGNLLIDNESLVFVSICFLCRLLLKVYDLMCAYRILLHVSAILFSHYCSYVVMSIPVCITKLFMNDD